MLIRKAFRFVSSVSFVGVAVWACGSSGTAPGFGSDTSSNNGGSTNNNNGSSSSGNGQYTGGGTTSTGGTTNTGGGTTNTGGGTTTNNGGGTTSVGQTSSSNVTVGNGAGTGCPPTPPTSCSATKAAGALALSGCYYMAATKGGGYAFVYGDPTSLPTACVDSTALCGSGTAAVASATTYGAGFGVGLTQNSGGGDAGAITSTAAGLSYTITGTIPSNGIQIAIQGATGACATPSGCCYRTTVATGTVPWASFTTMCYSTATPGPAFAATDGLVQVQFGAFSTTTAMPYDFCVTQLGY